MTNPLPYAVWTVGGRDYKLRLSASAIIEIEKKYGSIYKILRFQNQDDMPSLEVLLTFAQKGMSKFEHGMKLDDVYDLYDQYVDEGGDMMSFMSDVFLELFSASGFMPRETETVTPDSPKRKAK